MQVDQADLNKKNVLFKPDPNRFFMDVDSNMRNPSIQNNQVPLNNLSNLNQTSVLNRSSMMTYSKIVCCICSATIEANTKGMCDTCSRTEMNIAEAIPKSGLISYCKGCDRYLRPPWVRCGDSLESPEIMTLCLSKIKGLNKVKLVDSSFVWTEPHSKIIKIKLTVQKEMNRSMVETSFVVEFKVEWTQCDDCKKTFTPHIWNSSCQIRQKVNHKRTFMYLEQLILKNKAHSKALNVKEHPEGVDFYFANKSQALTLADFIKSNIPSKVKQSKQLVSHDQNSNIVNYKYTFMIEMAPVSKEDLIVLDKETSKDMGGIGPVLLCYKMSSRIHLLDPLTFNTYDFDSNSYWFYNFKSYVDRSCLEEFLIINVEEEVDYSKKFNSLAHSTLNEVEMSDADSKINQSKSTNYKNVKEGKKTNNSRGQTYYNNNHNQFKVVTVQCIRNIEGGDYKLITTRCHLGGKIRPGEVFFGYNLVTMNVNDDLEDIMKKAENIPEVILVKKKYVRSDKGKRHWKLKHLEKDVVMTTKKGQSSEDQYEEFLRDIEEDKEMRKNVNLYKDDEALKELEGKFKDLKVKDREDSDVDIKVDELLDDLQLDDKEEKTKKKESVDFAEEEVVDTFVKPQDVQNKKQKAGNKKQIGKRERTGTKIDSEDD
jgi:nonsense-mediated mRNA decay protein 3